MQRHDDQWPVRVMGALFGLGALAIGVLILVEPGQTALTTDAARFDFAAISIITGLIALLGSLLMPNVRDLWYCNPERSKKIGKEAGETLGKNDLRFSPDQVISFFWQTLWCRSV